MGIMDWFKSSGTKDDRQVERYVKKLTNKYVQTVERKRMIELLTDLGTENAIRGLLKRFTFQTEGSIIDDDEKRMAFESLLRLGSRSVEPIIEFIKTETAIYWPVRALTEIAGKEVVITTLLQTIETITESFGRDLERKEQLVSNLRELQDDRVYEQLVKLSKDEAEEIRVLAIDGLSTYGEKQAVEPLVNMLLNENETGRIRTIIVQLLEDKKWKVRRWKQELAAVIPDSYWVGDTGIVLRK